MSQQKDQIDTYIAFFTYTHASFESICRHVITKIWKAKK